MVRRAQEKVRWAQERGQERSDWAQEREGVKQVGVPMEGVEEMGQMEGEVGWGQERARRAQEIVGQAQEQAGVETAQV